MKINVRVIPNSRISKVLKIDEGNYNVKVDAPAIEGKANKRLVEILSDYFNVPKRSVIIMKGINSRKKIVEIII